MRQLVAILLALALVSTALAADSNQLVVVEDQPAENDAVVSQVDTAFEVEEEFIPTREWQKLKPNQAIPKGLHVRLNMQTGEREAKLLDEADQAPGKGQQNDEAVQRANRLKANLEESLKNLELDANLESELKDIGGKKFRTYDEIKKEMESLDLGVKTDYEVLTQLVARFKESKDNAEKLSILDDFEYYVHQYDNGLLLCDLGGFDQLINAANSTIDGDLDVRLRSLLVLGSALQSNPKVQIYAIKTNILKLLFVQLKESLEGFNLRANEYQSRLLFVLSGLLRNFPLAQSHFIQMGGVSLLGKMIGRDGSSVKIMVKVLTLADDLVKEKLDALKEHQNESQADRDAKIEQYKQLDMKEKLLENDWCSYYRVLLENANEHDQREKIFDSMTSMADDCKLNWSSNDSVLQLVTKLNEEYRRLSSQESKEDANDGSYFSKMSQKVDLIRQTLQSKAFQTDRTDL